MKNDNKRLPKADKIIPMDLGEMHVAYDDGFLHIRTVVGNEAISIYTAPVSAFIELGEYAKEIINHKHT